MDPRRTSPTLTSRTAALMLLLAGVAFGEAALAQNLDIGLRFSETQRYGTARSLGTGNAMAAIGADWTAALSNPAGLGAYRNNEVTLTVGGLAYGASASSLDGDALDLSASDFDVVLPQVAIVFTREPIGSRWTQLNFGFGVSQTSRFEELIAYGGNSAGSITDFLAERANDFYDGVPFAPDELGDFDTGLAFDVGALIPFDDFVPGGRERYTTDYINDRAERAPAGASLEEIFADPGANLEKDGRVARSGQVSSFDFTFGGNFAERLLVGATLGLVNSRFEETDFYQEADAADEVFAFERASFRQTTVLEATGVLGRIGIIYRASQALRVGLAYHSPTVSAIDDDYATRFRYAFDDGGAAGDNAAESPAFEPLEYTFVSPSQYRASVAGVFGRRGFAGLEVGYINYAGGRFNLDGEDAFEEQVNRALEESLRGAFQVNLGGELNLTPGTSENAFRVRAGFEWLGTPIAEVNGQLEDAAYAVAAGLGYRYNRLSLDLAYRHTVRPDRVYRPYTVDDFNQFFPQPEVVYSPTLGSASLTAGWKLVPRYYEGD